MPVYYDLLCAEVGSTGFANRNLRILFDTRNSSTDKVEAVRQVCLLRQYLRDIAEQGVTMSVYGWPDLDNDDLRLFRLKSLHSLVATHDTESVLGCAVAAGIDVVVTDNIKELRGLLTEREAYVDVVEYSEIRRYTEVFVRGHDIPWSFESRVWYSPWQSFFSTSDQFGQDAFSIHNMRLGPLLPDQECQDVARTLFAHRTSHICYTRDKLHFLRQQRGYAKRRQWERQSFLFETGYYLSIYYLALWGGIDQLSILLWKSLNISAKRKAVSLGNPGFRKKIATVSARFKEQIEDGDFLHWIDRLKWRRDTVAHRATIELTTIYESPENEMSEAELERAVDESKEWKRMSSTFPPQIARAFRATLLHKARIAQYRIKTDEVAVIRDGDESFFTSPLADIDWDFTNYKLAIMNITGLLVSYLGQRDKG